MIVVLTFAAISVAVGALIMVSFDGTAGSAGSTPPHWPASSKIRRTTNRPDLLVFVHPFCSCTAATIAELAKVSVRRTRDVIPPAITLLVYRPERNTNWRAQSIRAKARDLPSARIVWDNGGREGRLFGARTSGYTLLYSAAGDLLFHGGVTGSRGHEGDNFGLDQLVTALDSGRPARAFSFVFGCALGGPDAQASE